MVQIEKVEISYFRSIYSLKVKDLKDVCIFAGKNDTGKSNILKALNLFFNNEVDWQTPLNFSRDFSRKRLEEVRKETIKGRQFIRVKLTFLRGKRSAKSLPEKFDVTKTWYRDSLTPEVKSSIDRQFAQDKIKTKSLDRAQAGLQRFINNIRFEYIPAIKDRDFFIYSLGLLQDTILTKRAGASSIEESVTNLNTAVEQASQQLGREFKEVCNIETDIRLPKELAVLFRAFAVATKSGNDDIPLTMRGDGIQSRFIPSLLHYVAINSRLTYIWGFEEPENCLEHVLATKLANDLQKTYCEETQILLTSHSQAFVGLTKDNVSTFRIYCDGHGTNAIMIAPSINETLNEVPESLTLKEELGLMQLAEQQQMEFERYLNAMESERKKLEAVRRTLDEATSPMVLTEGTTDKLILEEAWKRLMPGTQRPFRITSCDPFADYNKSAGGAGTLKKALETVRADGPVTIGLFDHDEKGFEVFTRLDRNFESTDNEFIKLHKNGRASAFVIHNIQGREKYLQVRNLCLEFLFKDEFLATKVDGKVLQLKQKLICRKLGKIALPPEQTTDPHHRQIIGNKMFFAQHIVPTLPDEAFANFNTIFASIETILQ